MADRWSFVITLGAVLLLTLVSFYPDVAWSLDLSTTEEGSTYTRVDQILDNHLDSRLSELEVSEQPLTGAEAIKSMGKSSPKTAHKTKPLAPVETPVSLTPTIAPVTPSVPVTPIPQAHSSFLVLPAVIHHSQNKAFSDLPILLSSAVAKRLEYKFQQDSSPFTVLNPLYAYDDLKEKGLDGLYQKLVQDYLQAGQPNERDLLYLTDRLSTPNQHVDWVVFVQAEFDANHTTKPTGTDVIFRHILDAWPQDGNYFLKGTVEVYAAQHGVPLIWRNSTNTHVKMSDFGNFTKSVFDDSDSATNFKKATNHMAYRLISGLPAQTRHSYASVEAALIQSPANDNPSQLSPEDREALKRIIQN